MQMDNLFVPNDNNHHFQRPDGDFVSHAVNNNNSNNNVGSSSTRTAGMVAGVVLSTLFLMAILAIWIFLFIYRRDEIRKYYTDAIGIFRNKQREDVRKDDGSDCSVETDARETDPDSPTSSYSSSSSSGDDIEDVEERQSLSPLTSQYLDAWANSMTSIPLWNSNNNNTTTKKKKKKKKRGQPVVRQAYFRPGHEHSSSLLCIEEADSESCCSASHHSRSSSSRMTKSSNHRRTHSLGRTVSSNSDDDNNEEEIIVFSENRSSTVVGNNESPLLLPNLYDSTMSPSSASHNGTNNNDDPMNNNELLLDDVSLSDIVRVTSTDDDDDDDVNKGEVGCDDEFIDEDLRSTPSRYLNKKNKTVVENDDASSPTNRSSSGGERYSFHIFDGTNASGQFAQFVHDGDSDDERNDEQETKRWAAVQNNV